MWRWHAATLPSRRETDARAVAVSRRMGADMRTLDLLSASVRDLGLAATVDQLPGLCSRRSRCAGSSGASWRSSRVTGSTRRTARTPPRPGRARARALRHSRRTSRDPLRDDQRGGDQDGARRPRCSTSPRRLRRPRLRQGQAAHGRGLVSLPEAGRGGRLAGLHRRGEAEHRPLRAGADRPARGRAPGRRTPRTSVPGRAAGRLPLQPVPRRRARAGRGEPGGEPAGRGPGRSPSST